MRRASFVPLSLSYLTNDHHLIIEKYCSWIGMLIWLVLSTHPDLLAPGVSLLSLHIKQNPGQVIWMQLNM